MNWVLYVIVSGSLQNIAAYPNIDSCMRDASRWQEQNVVAVCQKAQDPNEVYSNMEFHMKKMLKLVQTMSKDAGD